MTELPKTQTDLQLSDGTELSLKNRLDIIDEGIRQNIWLVLQKCRLHPFIQSSLLKKI